MDLQQPIFDESFHEPNLPRRRSLLKGVLKIYVWALILLGGSAFGYAAYHFADAMLFLLSVQHRSLELPFLVIFSRYLITFIAILVPGGMMLMPPLLVWLEWKWAIRFNWLAAGLWGLILVLNLMSGRRVGEDILLPLLVYLPYWLLLSRIQKDWEENTVGGKLFKNNIPDT